jgi:plastocyanin
MRTLRNVMVVVSVMVLAGAACSSEATTEPAGGDTGGTATSPAADPGAAEAVVTIADFAFAPSQVTLPADGVIQVVNDDSTAHTFTMDDGSVDEQVGPGGTVEVTVGAAGAYHCEIHPSMTGEVVAG